MLDQLAWVTPPYFLLIELYQLAFYGAVWLIEISAKLIYTAICCRRQYTNYAYSLLFVCTLALFAWLVAADYSYDAWHILWKLILHCDKARSTHTLRHTPPLSTIPVWVGWVCGICFCFYSDFQFTLLTYIFGLRGWGSGIFFVLLLVFGPQVSGKNKEKTARGYNLFVYCQEVN